MNVYEFNKSLLERMEECRNVLQCKDSPVPASEVRDEWACHVELIIEPGGWQALWKINRATCEAFKLKYPTTVFGTVNNVFFQDLMADFSINAVHDDDVHLPELHEVPLEDLWPTIDQENTELVIKRTANCLDELRFFYRNVWMPWDVDNDNDDDADWCEKHLESRIRFCCDLKRKMSRGMAEHICKLIAEARYIRDKRGIMELELSDDEDAEEDPHKIEGLLRMRLRSMEIRNEMEMLENPIYRETYEALNFRSKSNNNDAKCDEKANIFVVTKKDTITKHLEYLEAAKRHVGIDEEFKLIPSFKDCLKICVARDQIYLPSGRHSFKLLQPLNSGGLLKAISTESNKKSNSVFSVLGSSEKAILTPEESDHLLLTFNGDYTIENLILDCRLVRVGVWVKGGTITLKNCHLIGDISYSTGIGIVIAGDATLTLENTLVENFGTGVTCTSSGKLILRETTITNCGSGLEASDGANVQLVSSTIENNADYGICFKTNIESGEKKKVYDDFYELRKTISSISGDVSLNGNKKGNSVIVDMKYFVSLQNSEYLEDNDNESEFNDVRMTNGLLSNGVGGHSSPNQIDDHNMSSLEDVSKSIREESADVSIICID